MIEFDRLAKNHIMDAYSQLLPATKRLIRKLSTSEHQIILQQQVLHQHIFSEKDIGIIHSSSSEKSMLPLSANKVMVSSISDDSFNETQFVKQRRIK